MPARYFFCLMHTNLHDRSRVAQRERHALLFLESNAPYGFTLSDKLAHQLPGLQIPDLDTAVTTTADNPGLVELKARDAVVVRGKSVDGTFAFQRPDANRPVGTSGNEGVTTHLELADQRGVALKNAETFAAEIGVSTGEPN